MRLSTLGSVATLALLSTTVIAVAQSRNTIQVAGSSTVLPFASIVAEEFGNAFPDFNTPVVGSGGTGGGFRQFCEGVGDNTIDIANASRRISAAEIATCNTNGVTQIIEVMFGYDGIVFATPVSQGDFALEPVHVYKAIAAQVPVDGALVANPYTSWDQIDPSLPAQAINLVVPASNHGTREVFQLNVVDAGCEEAGLPEDLSAEAATAACTTFRQDGRVVEIAGDYTETLARLQTTPSSVGVFGLSFYEENRDTLKVATVAGVEPTLETVASGEYPVSRPLYFYVKGEHIGVIPGIEEYVAFFLSDGMAGAGGRLEDAGLIPAPAEELAAALAGFDGRAYITP
ncbi:MAG: substrate-binding domain-containing protein [Bauldia sp.]|nr:substrate-binding domain-containing protein [Bauldia sp.]